MLMFRLNRSVVTPLATAVLGALLLLTFTTRVFAEDFPTKPITIVVPAGTGGSNDRAARLMSKYLAQELGQPVTVINRPGGGNLLGHLFFQQQPVDGYTLLATTAMPYFTVNMLVQKADFKLEDFAPVNLSDVDTSFMATSKDSKFNSIYDLVAEIKKNPGTVSFGVQPTSADMINFLIFLKAVGLKVEDVRVVTYDSGGPVRNGIVGAQFDVGIIGELGLRTRVDQVKPLMVFADEKLPVWDAPTVVEAAKKLGVAEYPHILSGSVRGFFVHGSLKEKFPDRFAKIVAAFKAIYSNPETIADFEKQKMTIDWYGPEKSAQILKTNHDNLSQPEYLSVLSPK